MTRVRQRVTRQSLGRRGTSTDPAWANRRRLLRARERLSDQAYARMWTEILAQEATGQLLAAWIAREELRYLLALARTSPARSEIASRLFAFYDWCARADVPEVTPALVVIPQAGQSPSRPRRADSAAPALCARCRSSSRPPPARGFLPFI